MLIMMLAIKNVKPVTKLVPHVKIQVHFVLHAINPEIWQVIVVLVNKNTFKNKIKQSVKPVIIVVDHVRYKVLIAQVVQFNQTDNWQQVTNAYVHQDFLKSKINNNVELIQLLYVLHNVKHAKTWLQNVLLVDKITTDFLIHLKKRVIVFLGMKVLMKLWIVPKYVEMVKFIRINVMMVILKMEMGVLQNVKSKINMNVIQAQYLQGVFIKKVMT